MKNYLLLILFLGSLLVSCKKEEDAVPVYLSSLTYSSVTSPSTNKTYVLYWNSNNLLDSVKLNAANPANNLTYRFYHSGNRLDSIARFDASNNWYFSAPATWTGDRLTAFWTLNYTYDSKGRILTKTYTSGSFFRMEYPGDSAIYFYDQSGPTPEIRQLSEYFDTDLKNPYKLTNYEHAYPMNNFIFNAICSDFTGMPEHPHTKMNIYDDLGNLDDVYTYTYTGNYQGYPVEEINYLNGAEASRRVFTYK